MLTYTDQLNLAREISGLSDVASVINFKRDINAGSARFLAKLSRPVDRASRFTSLVTGQQYYQLPEDSIRVSKVKASGGTNIIRPLTEIGDEEQWIRINQTIQSAGYATHFFVRGGDEIGLFPVPSQNVAAGLEIVYEPRHVLMTAEDYTTGTISVTNGNATVTGTSTTFTPLMANGNYILQVTDGTDGNYYRITGYTNASTITLENMYQGLTNSTAQYRIGQVTKIPEEYQEAPVDYALFRHFTGKGETAKAVWHKKLWEDSLQDAEDVYGMSTGNQVVEAANNVRVLNPLLDSFENQIRT